ncbi:MAG TPA: DUF885 family protein, partial [Thermoanaerobaculia bacterium]|nr:DUF885 family protein [Thermoanaerobaculia bacterium]
MKYWFAVTILAAGLLSAPVLAADETAEAKRLHGLFDKEWEARLKVDPFLATSVGRNEYNDQLPSADVADFQRWIDATKGFLTELKAIDRSRLSADDQVNYDIFRRQLENRVID